MREALSKVNIIEKGLGTQTHTQTHTYKHTAQAIRDDSLYAFPHKDRILFKFHPLAWLRALG